MSQLPSAEECPVKGCLMSGTTKRLFEHIRQVHQPQDWPEDLISRFHLTQCPHCRHWYSKLKQHLSKCAARLTATGSQSNESQLSNAAPAAFRSVQLARDKPIEPPLLQETLEDSLAQQKLQAWNLIAGITVDDILHSLPPRTVRYVPPSLRSLFQECVQVAFAEIEANPSSETGWKLLLLIPPMILYPQKRGGKPGMKETKSTYKQFLEYKWESLLQLHRSDSSPRVVLSGVNEKRKAALRLIKVGELSRAARVLTSKGLAKATDETVTKLKSKHPSRTAPTLDLPLVDSKQFSLIKSSLTDILRKAPRGSSCGISGWRYEHFQCLLNNCATLDSLHFVCSLISEGMMPKNVVPLISASRLIALPKTNGDVRPIVIGETLRRITARAICLQERTTFLEHFSPIQHEVATAGGTELLNHHIQLLMEENPTWSVLKTDVRNAFNSVSRGCLLKEVSNHFPTLTAHVSQMYSNPSPLVYIKNKSVVIIQSEEGVHQGDPLAPALFAAAIHPVLLSLQENHPNVTILAYLDDIYVIGPITCCLTTFEDIKKSLLQINLSVCSHKCELFCPTGSSDITSDIPVVTTE